MNAVAKIATADFASFERRVENYDWDAIGSDLNAFGSAVLKTLLIANECDRVASLYANDEHFRSHVNMARHGFGRGEYKYFKYPLPIVITQLRTALYSPIVTFANAWNERMDVGVRYPKTHADYLKLCHDAGQDVPRRCCYDTHPGTSIACTRICMATLCSHFRSRSSYPSPTGTLRAVSLS